MQKFELDIPFSIATARFILNYAVKKLLNNILKTT